MSRWTTREKVHGALLLLVAVGVVVHQASLWKWYVEDAAISFAYARHLIEGEGLVAYPGGERVEGYSNPTWVLVLAATQLVGLDPFFSTKYVQVLLALLTLPLVYLTVRDATDAEDHARNDLALVAVAFLGTNSQFAVYGAAGLENGLLNLLIALGCWRIGVEIRPSADPRSSGPFPWSAMVWLLVALTRPEGILYAAVAGFCTMVFHLHARRGLRSTVLWLLLFFVPFVGYQACRWWYFAWPFPNTYYAKVEEANQPWAWNRRAWNWTRNFFHDMGQGWFLPIWILGILGDGRRRWIAATVVFAVVGITLEMSHDQRWLLPVLAGTLWATFWLGLPAREPGPSKNLPVVATAVAFGVVGLTELLRSRGHAPNLLPWPTLLKSAPPFLLAFLALALPLASFRARGWQLRVLAWSLCCSVIFFAIYVQWDWMKGFRWYATAAVPGAILFAFGVDGFVRFVEDMFDLSPDRDPRRPWTRQGAILATTLVLLQLPANVWQTNKIAEAPDAAPRGVKVRIDYVDRLRDRLHVDGWFVDLDVDQGAHLWWSDFEMMDIAGLVDIPMGQHKFDRSFIREYVFEERKPHYAHVHDAWERNSRIPSHPEWRRDYVEVPGYASSAEKVHRGNFVRRDLFLQPAWPHGGEPVAIGPMIGLYPPVVPSEPAAGRKMYVEIGLTHPTPPPGVDAASRRAAMAFRTILFLSDETRLASWELPPGYDWVKPSGWNPDDVFRGRFDLKLPDDLPPGSYELGVLFLGADGKVIPADTPTLPPRLATGEIRFPERVTVLEVEARATAAAADREEALARAARLDCEGAEASWALARHHRPGQEDWVQGSLAQIRPAFAECWARSADGRDREEQIRRLVRARTWDWWNEAYRTRATPLGAELHAEGMAARAAGDPEQAYRLFSRAVDVDRTRSWSRRYAEEARVQRLGIERSFKADDASKARPEADPEDGPEDGPEGDAPPVAPPPP